MVMCCAVANCKNSTRAKKSGIELSFHSFPRDKKLKKIWIAKCKRMKGGWTPESSFICSVHFKPSDFVRDLRAELLGSKKRNYLMKGAIPTENLSPSSNQLDPNASVSSAAARRRQRAHEKEKKKEHDEIIRQALMSVTTAPTTTEGSDPVICNEELCKQQSEELSQLKRELADMKEMLQLKDRKLEMFEVSHKRNEDIEKVLRETFSENEVQLLLKRKKVVRWSSSEISKALALRYCSKQAYLYLKYHLGYPIPGLSSLKRWAKFIKKSGHSPEEQPSEGSSSETESGSSVVEAPSPEMPLTEGAETSEECLAYLAGWVAKKHAASHPHLGDPAQPHLDHSLPPWMQHLAYAGAIPPSSQFHRQIARLERIFIKLNRGNDLKGRNVLQRLTVKAVRRMEDEHLDETIIKTFITQRVFIRIKYLNIVKKTC